MKVAVSGATGLIGSALAARLSGEGHDVRPMARGTAGLAALEGTDAVVHLAGENIFGRWSESKKRRIRESRVAGTRLVSEAVARLARRPRVLVAASAVGYYGDRGSEQLTEASGAGDDFLARVVRDWEAATAPAAAAGVRVVNLRFAVILTPAGGALGKMLPAFRFGLGGPLGSGRQYFSWVTLGDALDAILHAIATASLSGPVNVAAPGPVTSREFARALGRTLRRPAVLPVPRLALRVVFGAESAAALLSSLRVVPARLVASGFRFRDPEIEPALRRILGGGG